jgi:hypothetical protein
VSVERHSDLISLHWSTRSNGPLKIDGFPSKKLQPSFQFFDKSLPNSLAYFLLSLISAR